MWKVLIADDEPKIRQGLRNLVNWSELGMELVGEAEDGEIALELAKATRPDILLVDICMPFLNGLQFIEQIKDVISDCQVIVITGHDEFVYAQQAIKLQVFDYLLKPVGHDQLLSVLQKAGRVLETSRSSERLIAWADREAKKNLPLLRETFCREWIERLLSEQYVNEQLSFLDMPLTPASRMIVLKETGISNPNYSLVNSPNEASGNAMLKATGELLLAWQPNIVFLDQKQHVIAIIPIKGTSEDYKLVISLEREIDRLLRRIVIMSQKPLQNLYSNVTETYQELVSELHTRSAYTPVVVRTLKFIDTNFHREELSLQHLADELKISPAYLSRLIKNEIGISFVEYLTSLRIQRAIQLMSDPTIRMQEIAKQIGYSNQHYFSTIFKKAVGVSPVEYQRNRGVIHAE